jgi:hypothetical protein
MKILTLGVVLLVAPACAGRGSGVGQPTPPTSAGGQAEATIALASDGGYCGVGRALAPLSVAAGGKVRWKIARGCGRDLEITVDNFARHDFSKPGGPKPERVLHDVKVGESEITATVISGVERCTRPTCYFKYEIFATPKGSTQQGRVLIDDPELQVRPPH